MKTVVVGSKNPAKMEAVKEAFESVFPNETFVYVSHDAQSGVPDQPFGSEETRKGAKNRADDCLRVRLGADYCVGLEGGLEEEAGEFWAMAWMCVVDSGGNYGFGKTGAFLLPTEVSQYIHEGKELGDAVDIVFNKINLKHAEGTVGVLTNNLILRKDFYREALIFALIPFLQPVLYRE